MSATAAHAPPARTAPGAALAPGLDRLAPAVLLGFALSLALSWPRAAEVWRTDLFADTDDAMRLVQVRAWLAGQGWFDLVAHRLAPPGGVLMHWSRIVDLPVGGLVRLFGIGVEAGSAERLARIVFPLAMQAAFLAVSAGLARLLLGPRGALLGVLTAVLTGFMFGQFPPGRIDHHAPQIVLLVGATWAVLASLGPGRPAAALLASLAMAVSLAISLENLPFLAVLAAVAPLAWVRDPARAGPPMLRLAGGLALSLPALFAATVPPERWGLIVGDAFCLAHLAAGLAGAIGLAALALGGSHLPRAGQRLAAVLLVGTAVGLLATLGFPASLRDPYAGLDPVLSSLWLSHVTEAQPLLVASRLRPGTVTMLVCPLVLGVVAAGAALATSHAARDRLGWGTVLALAVLGTAGTVWEVRVASTAQPFAALGSAWAVSRLVSLSRLRSGPAGLLACLTALPLSTLGWAFVPTGEGDGAAAAALAGARACRTSAALSPLASLPPGLVFAPIDDGAHLLVATQHAVLAAPYHRDERGNRTVVDGFLAAPDQAEALVRRTGARYLALCPGEVGIGVLAAAAPGGLGARLVRGQVPRWLVPLPLTGTPYRVFTLAPAAPNESVM